MRQPVAVITLCGRERESWISPWLMMRIVECVHDGSRTGRPVAIDLKCGVSPAARARNQIAQEFLASPAQWLIMLDNDIIPPAHFLQLIDAAEADGKFLFGIPTPMATDIGLTWNVLTQKDDLQGTYFTKLPKGWNRCDYLGGAFLAIHRSVLEAIKGDWFNYTATKSEDFAFSERARNAGFQLFFHGDYQCDHIHSLSMLEMLNISNERGNL
jgi:GT2 family glycosyltransferase